MPCFEGRLWILDRVHRGAMDALAAVFGALGFGHQGFEDFGS